MKYIGGMCIGMHLIRLFAAANFQARKILAESFTESRSEIRFQNDHVGTEVLHTDEAKSEKKNAYKSSLGLTFSFLMSFQSRDQNENGFLPEFYSNNHFHSSPYSSPPFHPHSLVIFHRVNFLPHSSLFSLPVFLLSSTYPTPQFLGIHTNHQYQISLRHTTYTQRQEIEIDQSVVTDIGIKWKLSSVSNIWHYHMENVRDPKSETRIRN